MMLCAFNSLQAARDSPIATDGRAIIDFSWLDNNAFDVIDRGAHCMLLCHQYSRCNAFTYDAATTTCYLSSKNVNDSDYTAGSAQEISGHRLVSMSQCKDYAMHMPSVNNMTMLHV